MNERAPRCGGHATNAPFTRAGIAAGRRSGGRKADGRQPSVRSNVCRRGAGARARKERTCPSFDTRDAPRRDSADDHVLRRCRLPFGSDVRQEVAQNALIRMHRRTARPRVILDVIVQPLPDALRYELRFARHGERRRSHIDDREYREEQSAKAGEPEHPENVRLIGVGL